MKITKIDAAQAKPDPGMIEYFDGEVKVQHLVTAVDSEDLNLMSVNFSAGARTRPHIHHQDQVLHITEGQGIVADETEKHVVSAGDIITIPTGTWHWHGATQHTAMAHTSIMKRGSTNWGVDEKDWAAGYED
jgi:quercetin dioxygenase-like cupin family protein